MKILISLKTGNYYYYNEQGEDYHCKEGFITESDLLSGEKLLISNTGKKFLCFNANDYDKRQKIKRGAQIITTKDLGYIIARSGISKTSFIVEAGTGSAAASILFSQIAKKVHSYEINEDHFKISQKNIEKFELENIKLIFGNLGDYIENEKEVDLLFLDMPQPEDIILKDLNAVKKGSYIISYLPSITQVVELFKACSQKDDLYIEEVSEIILREWKINEKIARPQFNKEIDHTAFLTFIRKL